MVGMSEPEWENPLPRTVSWGTYYYVDNWYHQGYHRDNGPAIEDVDGGTRYFIKGHHIHQLDNKRIYGKENLAKYLALI